MALNDGEVDMQIENEEVSQNPLSLAQLLDKDEILEGDINVEMAEEEEIPEEPKKATPKNFSPGETVWITGDMGVLHRCLVTKMEDERDLMEIRNAHGVLICINEDDVAMICLAHRGNSMGLRKIEVHIDALREMNVTRAEEMHSSGQGRTFDAAQEKVKPAAVIGGDEENFTQSDEELMNEDIPADKIHINEAWRYTVASDTISKDWLFHRAKYVPLRLTLPERKFMRLVVNTMDVSEYTDRIDILSWKSKAKKIHKELTEICSILCGFVIATNYRSGQRLVADKEFEHNEEFFQTVFEIARRYKVLNPEKMRTEYGKLIHVLMDSQKDQILELMGCRMVRPISTVYSYLEDKNCVEILQDKMELILDATAEIDGVGKGRRQIDHEIFKKEKAFKTLMRTCLREYPQLNEDDFERCMRSIGDNHNFLQWARSPVDRMIGWLKEIWSPNSPPADDRFNLGIRFGVGGARLSHSHSKHFTYVLQSLTLWREILHEMFQLWYLAESDLLEQGNNYQLRDTGQGLNRIQRCSRIARAMRQIVSRVQTKCGGWVGSAVVHLGDHNVPNALIFIDKYNQVPRILNPIVITINGLPRLCSEKPAIREFVRANYGDQETLIKVILTDFFRHGFDGSGADNFFDAGSCIDGRLTSAWNWCETIPKKKYYPIFQIMGFQSFDGAW